DSPPPKKLQIALNSGGPDEEVVTGEVVTVDRDTDLAVLKAGAPKGGMKALPPPLTVSSAQGLQETEQVYVFGYPYSGLIGNTITVSTSSVSSLRPDASGALSKLQVNGGIHPGNSG